MKHLSIVCTAIALAACISCGGMSSRMPDLNGKWMMVFTGAAASQGAPTPPNTTLTVTLSQNGNMLSGVVIGINDPKSSCLFGVVNSQTRFTVSGNVTNPVEAGSNLHLTLNFVTGLNKGSVGADASASDSAANGLFSVSSGGCTGGTFAMSKVMD